MKAEKPFNFESTPGKLPKKIIPQEYSVRIVPNVDKFVFTGTETIKVIVKSRQKQIVLNALEIDVSDASVDGKKLPKSAIQLDQANELLKLSLPDELIVGKHTIDLKFSGKINQQGVGLYYARYREQESGTDKIMIGTQFEATDARRLFPCWDEPSFRAKFQMTTVVPPNWTAVSNMPVEKETTSKEGKELRFGTTPVMSSYLNVLVAGELEWVETQSKNVHIRVVTTKGKAKWGRYALESSVHILDYYNEYLGVPYPLPKLDQIAVPGGFGGAMENWGGITYFESGLLFDPEKNSDAAKQDIFAVIAHEMAHMWFGDLVTMAWWDDLWLNEGFASWMGTKSTAFFNPQWEVWLRRNVPRNPTRRSGISKEQAMDGDVRKTTHPIHQPITTEAEANTAFDDITYRKGQSFILMLESFLGEETFRDGIRRYISKHEYSNATTADLWIALAEASGKPVEEIAAAWVHQPGFPVVEVTREGSTVNLHQDRMTMNFKESSPSTWPIPLTYTVVGKQGIETALMKDAVMTLSDIPPSAALKLNAEGAGSYRVQYDQKSWDLLLSSLGSLSVPDRVNLLSDQWALAQAGRASLQSYFDLIKKLPTTTELAERDQIINAFDSMDRLLVGSPEREKIQLFLRSILRPTFDALGWEAKPGEPARWTDLRASVVAALGDLGDPDIREGCQKRFQEIADGKTSVSPDMRRPILLVVGKYADEATWNKLHQLGSATTNIGEKQDYYEALAHATNPELVKRTLQISLTNELPTSRATYLVAHVARYSDHPELAWDFARANMPALMAKQDSVGAQSYAPSLFLFFSDPARIQELQDYSKANSGKLNEKEVAKAIDEIEVNAQLKVSLLKQLEALVPPS